MLKGVSSGLFVEKKKPVEDVLEIGITFKPEEWLLMDKCGNLLSQSLKLPQTGRVIENQSSQTRRVFSSGN